MAVAAFFSDEAFQDTLTALLCRDLEFLRTCSSFLDAKDFRPLPGQQNGRSRWITAERALDYYQRYGEPVSRLLPSELLSHAKSIGLGDRESKELTSYAQQLLEQKIVGVESVTTRVREYKCARIKSSALEEMIELQSQGTLTDERWLEISQRATEGIRGDLQPVDFFSALDSRIERRAGHSYYRHPPLLIEPFDTITRSIGIGQLGLVLAPYKRGKSLFLIWIARSYVVQRLNVLFITLEDPVTDVEDRFDAAVSSIPVQRLSEMPNRLRRQFAQFQRMAANRLRIYDGTEGGVTTQVIEQLYLRERDRGFRADAIIVDYDDEIVPSDRKKERRFEFADIYRDLRQMASKHQVILWTAAQTQRGTEELKVLGADRLAEDISKVRKATIAISLGKGEWGDESMYLWVAAYKFGAQHIGCNVMTDKSRMLAYDRERTQLKLLEERMKNAP